MPVYAPFNPKENFDDTACRHLRLHLLRATYTAPRELELMALKYTIRRVLHRLFLSLFVPPLIFFFASLYVTMVEDLNKSAYFYATTFFKFFFHLIRC